MKIDQNKPETWMVIGLALIVVGAVLRAADPDVGVGWFAIGCGVLLIVVGLVIFAVRAGTSQQQRPGDSDDGVG